MVFLLGNELIIRQSYLGIKEMYLFIYLQRSIYGGKAFKALVVISNELKIDFSIKNIRIKADKKKIKTI